MCPPEACHFDEIDAFLTDEQLILCLESIQNRSPGASLPRNVVAGVNPYLYEPSNLPENIWYVVDSEDPKQTEIGFWKAKGDPCQIYSDSLVIGFRTTLEFYEGHFLNGHRTDWLMQEYSMSHEGSSKVEGASSLCRVFLSDKEGENQKMDQHHANDEVRGQNNPLHDEGNRSGRPCWSKLQEDMERYQAMPFHQGDDELQANCISNGDYLELLDLLDPQSSSSSSENSSCLSQSSDEYFDPVALLQELEGEEEVRQTRPSSYNFSTSRPNEMAFPLAPEGSPISGDNRAAEPVKVEGSAPVLTLVKRLQDNDHTPENAKKRPPPASNDSGASSSRQKPGADKGKKVARGKTIKKFLCFMAF